MVNFGVRGSKFKVTEGEDIFGLVAWQGIILDPFWSLGSFLVLLLFLLLSLSLMVLPRCQAVADPCE